MRGGRELNGIETLWLFNLVFLVLNFITALLSMLRIYSTTRKAEGEKPGKIKQKTSKKDQKKSQDKKKPEDLIY